MTKRLSVRMAYVVMLACALGLALWGLVDTLWRYGNEPYAISLERGGTSLALLLLVVAYAQLLRNKRVWRGTVPVFAAAYISFGIALSSWLRALGKGFAPLPPDAASGAFWAGLAAVVVVVLLALWGWFWCARKAIR